MFIKIKRQDVDYKILTRISQNISGISKSVATKRNTGGTCIMATINPICVCKPAHPYLALPYLGKEHKSKTFLPYFDRSTSVYSRSSLSKKHQQTLIFKNIISLLELFYYLLLLIIVIFCNSYVILFKYVIIY